MKKTKLYSLVGVDGNAYALMGYTQDAMQRTGFSNKDIDKMLKDATSSDYNHLVAICSSWICKVNKKVQEDVKKGN